MSNTKYKSLLYSFIVIFLNGSIGSVLATDKEPLHRVSAKECKTCHEEIYSQWKGSMHANSTALKDPIHGTFYNAVIGDPKEEGIKKNGNTRYVYNATRQLPR